MRIAIPMMGSQFSAHFGRCDGLYLCDLDPLTQRIDRPRHIQRDTKGCESLPKWLSAMGVQMVIVGGLGAGAQQRLAEMGIEFSAGHKVQSPEQVIEDYFAHAGQSLPNACGGHDGSEHDHHEHHHCRH